METKSDVAVRIAWRHVMIAVAMACLSNLAVAEQSTSSTLSDLFEQAETKRRQLLFDDAASLARQIRDRASEDRTTAALAQARLAKYLIDAGRIDEAEAELQRFSELFPQQVTAQQWAAVYRMDLLQSRGDLAGVEAAALSLQAEATDAPEFQAWADVKLSEVAIARGQQASAIANLQSLVARVGQTSPVPANWARVNLSRAMTDIGDWNGAIEASQNVQADYEAGNASGEQLAWAWVYRLRARRADSVQLTDCRALVELAGQAAMDEGHPKAAYEALAGLGKAYLDDGLFNDAVAIWSQAVDLAGTHLPNDKNWARVRWIQSLSAMGTSTGLADVWNDLAADHAAGQATDEALVWGSLFRAEALIASDRFADASNAIAVAVSHDSGDHGVGIYLDGICLKAAERLSRWGMQDRALAWLRRGIGDAAVLEHRDKELIETVHNLVTGVLAQQWNAFLLDPITQPDPLAAYVEREFGAGTLEGTSPGVSNSCFRLLAVATCYQRDRNWDGARLMFEQSEELASTAREHGEALMGSAYVLRRAERKIRRSAFEAAVSKGISAEEILPGETSLGMAHRAAAYWRYIIETAENRGEAHYAVDMLAATYSRCGYAQQATAALRSVIENVDPDHDPSTACVARYRLMQEYIAQSLFEEAVATGEDLLTKYQDRPFGAGDDWLVRHTFIHMAHAEAQRGDTATAFWHLDDAARRWPEEAAHTIEPHRELLTNRSTSTSE